MKKRDVLKLLIVVMILTCGFTWWFFEVYKRQKPIESDIDQEGIIQDEILLLGETIESGLRDIGELSTAEYYFTRSETVQDSKKIDLTSIGINFIADIPLTSNSFTYSYDGSVKAGIDFSEIKSEVDQTNKEIIIYIPKTKILSCEVDPDSYKFYEIKNNILNPISPESYAVSFSDLIHAEENRAIESGILEKASKNAKTILNNFIKSYNMSNYKITLKDS